MASGAATIGRGADAPTAVASDTGAVGRPDSRRGAVAWLILATGVGVALGPPLAAFGRRLWSEEHYQFFPLLLLAAAWIGVQRYRAAGSPVPGKPLPRTAAWAAALAVTAAAVAAASPTLAALALLTIMPAAVFDRGGLRLLRRLAPAWCLLWLVIPPPFGADRDMVVGMQRLATACASGLLDLAGVRHLQDGVAIRVPGSEFFVDAACSGVHSLFASLAFAGVLAAASGHGPVRAALLLAATAGWVVCANAVRVFAVVVLSTRYDLPVVEGFGHEALGLAVFAVIVGLVLSSDRLLLFLLPGRADAAARAGVTNRTTAEPGSRQGGRAAGTARLIVLGVVFLGLGVGDRVLASPAASAAAVRPAGVKSVAEGALPASWEGWRKADFRLERRTPDNPAGEWSRIWTFRKGRLAAAVSLDGPYAEWHDLRLCYEGLGFEVAGNRNVASPGAGAPPPYTEIDLKHPAGRYGCVLFAAYDYEDRPVPPPGPVSRRLASMVTGRYGRLAGAPKPGGAVYQVQLFTESRWPLTADDRRELGALFHAMRHAISSADATETTSGTAEAATTDSARDGAGPTAAREEVR